MRHFIHMHLHSGNLSHFSHFLGKFKHDEWITFPTIFSTFTHFSHFWPKKFQIGFIYNISSSYYSLIILKQKGHRPQEMTTSPKAEATSPQKGPNAP